MLFANTKNGAAHVKNAAGAKSANTVIVVSFVKIVVEVKFASTKSSAISAKNAAVKGYATTINNADNAKSVKVTRSANTTNSDITVKSVVIVEFANMVDRHAPAQFAILIMCSKDIDIMRLKWGAHLIYL
jgi:hypothetical protein